MKVEQLKNVQIDWTKPQVLVNEQGRRVHLVINDRQDEATFTGFDVETGNIYCLFQKKEFKPETGNSFPIELKLTIESENELCNLLHRCSLDGYKVDENRCLSLKHESNASDMTLYNLLEQLAKELNLFKND